MEPKLGGFLKIKISLLMDHLHASAVPVDVIASGVEFSLPDQYGMQAVKGDASQLISTHAAIEFSSSGACFRLAEKSFGIFCLKRQWFLVHGFTSTLDLAGSGDWDLCYVHLKHGLVWLRSMESFVNDDDAIRRNKGWQWRLADASADGLSATERFLLFCWLGMGASLLGTVVFLYFVERCDI